MKKSIEFGKGKNNKGSNMDRKKKRLVEEDLTEVGTAQPVPATAQEVAAATPTAPREPAADAPKKTVSVTATPQVAAGDSPASDPLTPPAEGMVPTGWAYPEDLAAAIAMATGDVEPAGTAADAAVTEQPLVTDEPGEGTVPANVPVDAAVPENEGDLTMEEKKMLLAFRKRKFKEDLEAAGDESADFVNPFEAFTDESAPETLPEVEPSSNEVVNTEEEDKAVSIDDILASIDAIFGGVDEKACEEECEECEEEHGEECEKDCDKECDEQSGIESVASTFDNLSSVLRNLSTDEEAGVGAEETVGVTKDEVADAFNFLSALEDNLFYDGKEDESEEEEETDEEDDEELTDPEEEELSGESFDDDFPIKEANGIKYPAGSAPKSSAIVSSAATAKEPSPEEYTDTNEVVNDGYEEDLVRSYEEKSRARRKAFLEFRESMIQRRKEGSRFNEALNTSSTATNSDSTNKKAWSNNTFIEKYNESRKLNWRELFDRGLLG